MTPDRRFCSGVARPREPLQSRLRPPLPSGAPMTRRAVLAFAIPLVLLAGCSASPASAPSANASAEAVEVQNCGTDVTFTSPPQRVVTIKSTSTEMLLALGLGDRIVGTAFQDGPVPDEWAAAEDGV